MTDAAIQVHPQRPTRGDGLLSRSALLALLIWLLNDHVLKHCWAGVITGKLSDIASLIVLPLAVQAAWELSSKREPFVASRGVAAAACVVVGAFFVWMESTSGGSLVFRSILAFAQWPFLALSEQTWVAPRLVAHRADLEDLLTLPSLLIAYHVGVLRWRSSFAHRLASTRTTYLSVVLLISLLSASSSALAQVATPPEATLTSTSACTAESDRSTDANRRLATLQLRLDELRHRERARYLVLPVLGVVLGVGGLLQVHDAREPGDPRGKLVVASAGWAALGVASAVWLGTRVRARRAGRPELRLLEGELEPARQDAYVAEGAFSSCYAQLDGSSEPLDGAGQLYVSQHGLRLERQRFATDEAARLQRYPLGPPIGLMVTGYASALILAAGAVSSWWVFAPSFELDTPATDREKRLMRGMGFGAIGGLAIGAAGTAWLVKRIRLRRELRVEQRSSLGRSFVPAFAPAVGKGSVSLSVTFAL